MRQERSWYIEGSEDVTEVELNATRQHDSTRAPGKGPASSHTILTPGRWQRHR